MTPDEEATLTELWHKGLTVPQISEMTGIKVGTIHKRAHRLQLPKRKGGPRALLDSDPEKRKWFIRNYPEMGNATISVFLGLSEDHIGRLARQLGLKKSEQYWQGVREYHRKKVREFHAARKGDRDYYRHNQRPRLNGKLVSTKTTNPI